jgi:hypothetical protein
MKNSLLWIVLLAFIAACTTSSQRPFPGGVNISSAPICQPQQRFCNPALEIVSLQKVGDAKVIYPSADKFSFVRVVPGNYIARIKCLRPTTDKESSSVFKSGTPLGTDQIYSFTLKDDKEVRNFSLDCAIAENGTVYVWLGEIVLG